MKSILKLACIYFSAAATALAVGPVTITFDDLPAPASAYADYYVPSSYAGLQWNNFGCVDALNYTYNPSGYRNGMVSANNVAYNSYAGPALFSDGAFDLNSAYLTGAWNDGLQVRVQGFRDSTLVYDNTYTVNSTAPSLIQFDYLGVDSVQFSSWGGTFHGSPYPGGGTQFAMDNLIVTIPEPSSFALAGLASAALLIFCRRK